MNSYEILIPFHSNKILLEYCINSIIATSPDNIPITIIANNENDEAIDIYFDSRRVHIVKVCHSLYYPICVNYGMNLIKSSHVFVIDADTFHFEGWFEHMVKLAESDSNIGIIGSCLLETTTDKVKDYGLGFSGYNWTQIYKGQKISSPLIKTREFQAVCTASCLVNKKAFDDINGFSDYCNISYSDIDLCIRMAEKGYKIIGCSDSKAYHKGNASNRIVPLLKKDCYSLFMAKCYNKMRIDISDYLMQSCDYINIPEHMKYIFLDFSSIINSQWYKDQLEKNLNISIVETYNYKMDVREIEHINLVSVIKTDIYRNHYSFIYFIDLFTALKDNNMWHRLRKNNIDNDLVVDRHGTVCLLNNVSKL